LYPAEIHTVVAIGESEGISVTELARKLNLSKATLSERIQKLVKKDFVIKKKNPADRKAVVLFLTENGQIACEYHEKHHMNMYDVFRNYFKDETGEKIELFSKTFKELIRFEQNAYKKE
jgi:DNA-binding MarR family transcriptional regulator